MVELSVIRKSFPLRFTRGCNLLRSSMSRRMKDLRASRTLSESPRCIIRFSDIVSKLGGACSPTIRTFCCLANLGRKRGGTPMIKCLSWGQSCSLLHPYKNPANCSCTKKSIVLDHLPERLFRNEDPFACVCLGRPSGTSSMHGRASKTIRVLPDKRLCSKGLADGRRAGKNNEAGHSCSITNFSCRSFQRPKRSMKLFVAIQHRNNHTHAPLARCFRLCGLQTPSNGVTVSSIKGRKKCLCRRMGCELF